MLCADPSAAGALSWLTEGAARMPQWRYDLAMFLAFPGTILYGTALFSLGRAILTEKGRKIYHYLNAFGLTPWIALHLFYVMILNCFAWMHGNGYGSAAAAVCEGLFSRLSWVVLVSEAMMLPVFVYWFILEFRRKTVFPRWMAFTNVLFVYIALKGLTAVMPASAFRLGFINGLMSESMFVWFACMLIWLVKKKQKT